MFSPPFQPAELPTMYFIGVTTAKSSIMRVFPQWARFLALGDCRISGMDLRLHDDPEAYRSAVGYIKSDPMSLGALVTTHKLDLLRACRDQFDEIDHLAGLMNEISSISKSDGRLVGSAKDPITSGLALDAFLPNDHWQETNAQMFIIGAGGSATALSWHVLQAKHGKNRPASLHIAARRQASLDAIRQLHEKVGVASQVVYHLCPDRNDNDAIVATLPAGSVVVNATGLGKDSPGSPLTDAAIFPRGGIAWDFNYRGDLVFLDQARSQQSCRELRVEDGWIYFIHGWTRVIAEVFHMDIPTAGPVFDELSRIAAATRQ